MLIDAQLKKLLKSVLCDIPCSFQQKEDILSMSSELHISNCLCPRTAPTLPGSVRAAALPVLPGAACTARTNSWHTPMHGTHQCGAAPPQRLQETNLTPLSGTQHCTVSRTQIMPARLMPSSFVSKAKVITCSGIALRSSAAFPPGTRLHRAMGCSGRGEGSCSQARMAPFPKDLPLHSDAQVYKNSYTCCLKQEAAYLYPEKQEPPR